MKNQNIFFVILIFTLFLITGCGVTPVPYSFAKNESENGTAAITFIGDKKKGGVDLYYFEDTELPNPRRGNYWAPVTFPAERPFNLTVNIYESADDMGSQKIFKCPALTAGNNYRLEIEIKKAKSFLFVTISEREEKLVLIDAKTKSIVYEQRL